MQCHVRKGDYWFSYPYFDAPSQICWLKYHFGENIEWVVVVGGGGGGEREREIDK